MKVDEDKSESHWIPNEAKRRKLARVGRGVRGESRTRIVGDLDVTAIR